MKYFLIGHNEDGIRLTQFKSKTDLLEHLSEQAGPDYSTHYEFVDYMPDIMDGQLCKPHDPGKGFGGYLPENTVVIIEGNVVVPKPKTVVQEYDI